MQVDLFSADALEAFANNIAADHRLDILVNNAGMSTSGPIGEGEWHEQGRMQVYT